MKRSIRYAFLCSVLVLSGLFIFFNGIFGYQEKDAHLTWNQCLGKKVINRFSGLDSNNSLLQSKLDCGSWDLPKYWYEAGFSKGNWPEKKGFGYEDYCDQTKPLGITLKSVHYLHFNQGMPGFSGQAYDFFIGRVKKIEGHCAREDDGAAADYKKLLGSHRVRLFKPFFTQEFSYTTTVLLHEAGHYYGGHNGKGGRCDGESCDERYSDKRANYWQVQGAWSLALNGKNLNAFERSYFIEEANYRLNNRFQYNPGFFINSYGRQQTNTISIPSSYSIPTRLNNINIQ
jgi:hypothetical protein